MFVPQKANAEMQLTMVANISASVEEVSQAECEALKWWNPLEETVEKERYGKKNGKRGEEERMHQKERI